MNGFYKGTAVLPFITNLPEDTAQNSFYMASTDGDADHAAAIAHWSARIIDFYNGIHPGSANSLSDFIGDQVSRSGNACSVNVYFQGAGGPADPWGSPVGTVSWTMGTADAGIPLPAEVAAVMTYHADLTDVPETAPNPTPPPATIRPAARLRGRIYIGPLQQASGAESGVNGDLVPGSTFRNTMDAAAQDFFGDNTLEYRWFGASITDNAFWEVTGGYNDNAFDTQRRRGTAPTSRLSWGT